MHESLHACARGGGRDAGCAFDVYQLEIAVGSALARSERREMIDMRAIDNRSLERGRVSEITTDDLDAAPLQSSGVRGWPDQRSHPIPSADQSIDEASADEARGTGDQRACHFDLPRDDLLPITFGGVSQALQLERDPLL
jgi:hypothetical protein